jgi:hypothetical protein
MTKFFTRLQQAVDNLWIYLWAIGLSFHRLGEYQCLTDLDKLNSQRTPLTKLGIVMSKGHNETRRKHSRVLGV